MLKLLLTGVVLFATVGVFVAKVVYVRLGLEPDYLYISVAALAITLLLVFRGALMILLVGIMTIAVNLPDEMLFSYGMDRDILLTTLFVMMLYPFVHRALSS